MWPGGREGEREGVEWCGGMQGARGGVMAS